MTNNFTDIKEYANKNKEYIKYMVDSNNLHPVLAVIQIDNDEASNVYIRNMKRKHEEFGIEMVHIKVDSKNTSQEELKDLVYDVSHGYSGKKVDAVIIQRPIPDKYDIHELGECIPSFKDVDGIRPDSVYYPCTPYGISMWLDSCNIDLQGKDVVVVGRSDTVGKPMVNLLIEDGATVTCCNSKTKDIQKYTKAADIIISAIGKPKFFDSSYFSDKNILIVDVGINTDENGKLCGDIDYKDVNSKYPNIYITPVPGGVGLLTQLQLLFNICISSTILD